MLGDNPAIIALAKTNIMRIGNDAACFSDIFSALK